MERQFNTAGPSRADLHYLLDPLARIDFEEVLELIEAQRYFVLHAPRQTGKTTALLALRSTCFVPDEWIIPNRRGYLVARSVLQELLRGGAAGLKPSSRRPQP